MKNVFTNQLHLELDRFTKTKNSGQLVHQFVSNIISPAEIALTCFLIPVNNAYLHTKLQSGFIFTTNIMSDKKL